MLLEGRGEEPLRRGGEVHRCIGASPARRIAEEMQNPDQLQGKDATLDKGPVEKGLGQTECEAPTSRYPEGTGNRKSIWRAEARLLGGVKMAAPPVRRYPNSIIDTAALTPAFTSLSY